MAQWQKWLTKPGNIRVVSIEAIDLMRELNQQQGLTGLPQVGFGEAVIGALLIASAHKSNESINLSAQGSGLYRQAVVDASPDGLVRGFLREEKDASKHTYGAEGVNGPWGSGVLSILYTKNFEGKYPYTGMVPISTGLLDDAINEYYRDSEQLVSRIGLAVEMAGDHLRLAGGALVQALGGASSEELDAIKSVSVEKLRQLAAISHDSQAFQHQAQILLGGRNLALVETQKLKAFCTCSQERIERALVLTGREAILEALDKDPYLEITCDFCRKEYRLSAERIRSLFSTDPSRLQ